VRITGEESDEAILRELGGRIARIRLRRNITQDDLATEAGVSAQTVRNIEEGRPARLVSMVRVLRALGIAGGLQALVPEPTPSPIEMLDMQGRQRRRASRRGANRGSDR
jgi:transcriptional regulator with XRE-family HTH domain